MSDDQTNSKQIPRNADGTFQKGFSGNPHGGSKSSRIVRERIAARLDDVLASLFKLIDDGDAAAIKLALDRVSPALKPETEPNAIDGLAEAKTLVDKAEVVLREIGRGNVDADRAAKILNAIASAAQLTELEELKRRILLLEGRDLL